MAVVDVAEWIWSKHVKIEKKRSLESRKKPFQHQPRWKEQKEEVVCLKPLTKKRDANQPTARGFLNGTANARQKSLPLSLSSTVTQHNLNQSALGRSPLISAHKKTLQIKSKHQKLTLKPPASTDFISDRA